MMRILATAAKAWGAAQAANGLGRGARKGVKGLAAYEGARSIASRRRSGSRTPSKGALVGVGLAGAAVAYLADPQQGARRRNMARDRAVALFRRGAREASRKAQYGGGVVQGVAAREMPSVRDAGQLDDVTLTRKVESEVFRPADAPKGQVSINAQDGVVSLRGELKRPEDINDLVKSVARVDGVQRVENLLHTPGTPAPGRTGTAT